MEVMKEVSQVALEVTNLRVDNNRLRVRLKKASDYVFLAQEEFSKKDFNRAYISRYYRMAMLELLEDEYDSAQVD